MVWFANWYKFLNCLDYKSMCWQQFGKIFFILLLSTTPLLANWEMFSDDEDTYIYNKNSGEIYVRHRKGGLNYDDSFVKMPIGKLPTQIDSSRDVDSLELASPTNTKKQTSSKSNEELKLESQRLQRKLMDAVLGE